MRTIIVNQDGQEIPKTCSMTMSGNCEWSEEPNAQGYHYCLYCGLVDNRKDKKHGK
jgi:hypothetical protein